MLLTLYATEFTFTIIAGSSGHEAAAVILGYLCFLAFQAVAGVQSRPAWVNTAEAQGPWKERFWVLNLIAPAVVGGVARLAFYNTFNKQIAASSWRCNAGAVIGCSCNVTADWCTSTASCISSCGVGKAGVDHHECMPNWCSDTACIGCLLNASATAMPNVTIGTYIEVYDNVPMCVNGLHKFHCFYWCMHLWYTILPIALMTAIAIVFLVREYLQSRQQGAAARHTTVGGAAGAGLTEAAGGLATAAGGLATAADGLSTAPAIGLAAAADGLRTATDGLTEAARGLSAASAVGLAAAAHGEAAGHGAAAADPAAGGWC